MVLGIFFACVMIGWMWTLVGLGDAMIWRDRSQEAADAITYTSAVVHAKGMNFIAFCNILMLLITALYLAMAMIFNITDFLLIVTGRNDDTVWICPYTFFIPPPSVGCHDAAKDELGALLSETGIGEVLISLDFFEIDDFVQPIHDGLETALNNYEKYVMWNALPALSDAETKIAQIAPWAGAAIGALVGYRYVDWGKPRYGIGISPSMVPASKFPAPVKKWDSENRSNPYTGRDARLGLPVQIEELSRLCEHDAQILLDAMLGWVGKLIPGVKQILGWLISGAASTIADDYCKEDSNGMLSPIDSIIAKGMHLLLLGGPNPTHYIYKLHKDQKNGGESLWGMKDSQGNPKYGPHEVVEYAENGNDWMQVWGAVFAINRPEQSQKKVGAVYSPKKGAGNTDTPQSLISSLLSNFNMYFAQSEFYYDCKKEWKDDDCNGGDKANASYNMNWRARLRRLHGVSWGKDLLGWIVGTSFGSELTDAINSKVGSWVQGSSTVSTIQSNVGNWFNTSVIEGALGDLQEFAGDQVSGMINPAATIPDIIH